MTLIIIVTTIANISNNIEHVYVYVFAYVYVYVYGYVYVYVYIMYTSP